MQEQTGRNNLRLEIRMGQLTAPGNLMLITMPLLVAALGHVTAAAPEKYRVFGRPNEIRQMYTSIASLLNLLCIVNAVYLAYLHGTKLIGE